MNIRTASAEDLSALIALHDAAFGTPDEGKLVADLAAAHMAVVSLVAVKDARIVGHILFSPLIAEIEGETALALSLAPLAVHPAHQRQGIGSALTKAGLGQARAAGWEAVIVLGHPDFYPRFGFSAELAQGFEAPFSGPAFMGLELTKNSLSGRKGRIIYPAPFGIPALEGAPAVS